MMMMMMMMMMENVIDSGAGQQRPYTGHSDSASQMHGQRAPG